MRSDASHRRIDERAEAVGLVVQDRMFYYQDRMEHLLESRVEERLRCGIVLMNSKRICSSGARETILP